MSRPFKMLRGLSHGSSKWEVIPWKDGRKVNIGERVGFRVHNKGRSPVDVTLLYVDATFGITAVFPPRFSTADNRVEPGKATPIMPAIVAPPEATENMIAIAVRSDINNRQSVDFSCLEQESLARARGSLEKTRGPASMHQTLDSPLGKLLQKAM